MAEAMAYGKPVIATGYSGNLDFMNDDEQLPRPARARPDPPGCDPYPEGAQWAEPDIERAAELMRHVYENRADAETLGRRAQADIREKCSPEHAGAFIARRVDDIRKTATYRDRKLPSRSSRASRRGSRAPQVLSHEDPEALDGLVRGSAFRSRSRGASSTASSPHTCTRSTSCPGLSSRRSATCNRRRAGSRSS